MRPELQNLPLPNWFNHGAQVLGLLDIYQPLVCVELGSNRGGSSIAIARTIRAWGGQLTCVDQWDKTAPTPCEIDYEEFLANIDGVREVIDVIRASTIDAALKWCGGIDFLYVDADHSKAGCLADLMTWWPHVRAGGLVVGDDYDDVRGDPATGVTAAWDEFERLYHQSFNRTPSLGVEGRLIWGVKQ